MILILGSVFPISAFAQSFSITKNPPFPKAGDDVLLSISSFVLDLNNSLITWKEDGETLFQGVGAKSYTIENADNQNILVEILDNNSGQKISQSIKITTEEVDLLWEAVGSYTPPFYKGKALPPLEANINVVAVPGSIAPSELTFNWEKDYGKQQAQSGRGKNSFSFVATALEQLNAISVSVDSKDSSFQSQNDLVIRYGNSEVVFYEDHSELGTLFNKAVMNGHFVGDDKEITLTAIPFFVSVDTLSSSVLDMVWSLNGVGLPVQKVKNKIRIGGDPNLAGNVLTSLFIKNTTKLFEEGTVGLSLQF